MEVLEILHKGVRNINNKILPILEGVLTFIVWALVALVFLNVVFRYFIFVSISWAEELSRYMMLAISFLGGTIVYNNKQFVSFDTFFNMINKKVRKIISFIFDIMIALFLIILIKESVNLIISNLYQVSPAIRLPMPIVYATIPLGSGIFLLAVIEELLNKAIMLKKA